LLATTPQTKELRYVSAGYELPINDNGTILKLKGVYSKSYPGTPSLEAIDMNSSSSTLSFGLDHPFLRTQNRNFSGYGKFDIKYTDTKRDTGRQTKDETRVLRAGGNFDYVDQTKAMTRLNLEWSHGFDGFGAESNNTNSDGVVDFDKITFSLSRTQPLSAISPKLEKWTLYGAAEGQFAANPLLSGEECGVGGKYFGRAYDSSEITGENCLTGSVELSRSLDTSGIESLKSGKSYLLYDIGKIRNRNASATNPKTESLASMGAGLEFSFTKNIDISVEMAKALTKNVANEGDKDLRVFGAILVKF